MSWALYTEDPDETEQTPTPLFPSKENDLWDGSSYPAHSPAPGLSHVSFEQPFTGSVPAKSLQVGSAPASHFGAVVQPEIGRAMEPVRRAQFFYSVSFHPNRTQVMSSRSEMRVGDFVITDADRGIDIGRIVGVAERPPPREMKNVKSIVRVASQSEIAQLPRKEFKEANALQVCQVKAKEMEMPMEITGAEFQFDGKKLTFYYMANHYVDFTPLVRTLFKIYGTRIWMVWHDGSGPVKDVYTRGE